MWESNQKVGGIGVQVKPEEETGGKRVLEGGNWYELG